MKLDTVRLALRRVLSDFYKGRVVPLDPELIESVLWFLDLLRKREGYDVEQPSRRESRGRHYEEPYRGNEARGGFEFDWRDGVRREEARWFNETNFDSEEFWRKQQKVWEEEILRQKWRGFDESFRGEEKPPKTDKKREWYEILGVRPNSTKPQRKKAYQSLAMKYHPDRPGGSHEKMSELNQAKKEAGI